MDERRVADYFVVAGLPDHPEPLGDFSRDGAHLKAPFNQAPITDVTVIFPSLGEDVPPDYYIIDTTPTGLDADLNHGSLLSPQVFLCCRRGRDRLPLVDIGVMYEGKERIMSDAEVVHTTPGGRVANVNNSGAKTFVTYRRAPSTMPCNELVVTDICVIVATRGETPPHAFCKIEKNLNKGMVGSDVFLCYKKSMNRANLIPYKPGILARYPHSDYTNFPLPATVPMFCLPMGSSVECWPATATQPRPVFSTFVLTVSDAAEKVYGAAVTFYERVPAGSLTAEQCHELQLNQSANIEQKTVNINKCICLLSHWPFFDTFEKFLVFLYDMACSGPHAVPIERHISHFLEDVPFPSAQRPCILVQLSAAERVLLTQPEDLPLPRSGAGFRELLMNLGPDNCLMILLLALTEQKLLVHSLRPDVLTAVAEAVSMIIFPFKWQCPYVPLCPLGLAEVLHAPLPFLIGVDSRFFDLYDPPSDVNCVDLDTNNITVCEEKRAVLTAKLLPKKPARILRNTLIELNKKNYQFKKSSGQISARDISIDRDFKQKRKEQSLELEIQEAFLRFMATVLKGYRMYLLPITKAPTIGTTDPSSLFELQGFLRSRDKTHYKFFNLVMKTQMFIRFIEERSFVSDMDASLAFFDECTEKVECDDSDGHLLELDESHQSERTVFVMPPEPNGLPPGRMYSYKSFMLDPLLFSRKEVNFHNAVSRLSGVLPGSPMARRTKHEIKSAQKLARKHAETPELWAKCLLTTCYSLWFIHLPSYAMQSGSKAPACLQSAYEFLVKIQKMKLQPTDEVCYRVMMQLCGMYSQPVLAVKLLSQMKRSGIQPNAITYGFYNRAVLEATWPSDCTNSSQLLWNKLRNVIIGVALFRRAGIRCRVSDDSGSLVDGADVVSRTSLDSASSHQETANVESVSHDHNKIVNKASNTSHQQDSTDYAAFDRFRSRVGSIVRPSGAPLLTPRTSLEQQTFESSAGLLMTGLYDGPTLSEESDLFDGELNEIGVSISPSNARRRNRSGSCSEFMFSLRQGHLSGGGNCQGSPQTPRSSDANSPSECFRLLIRSESFANDAQILDKLNRIKLGLPNDAGGLNGRVAPIPEGGGDADRPHVTIPSSSRSLFGRRSSFTFRRTSRESSTENLEERSSAGSTDDLDSTGSHTPKHSASKLFAGLGDRVSRISSAVWERSGPKGPFNLGHTKVDMQTYVNSHNKKNSSLDSLAKVSACDSGGSSSDLELQNNRRNGVGDLLSHIDSSGVKEECGNCDSQDVIMNRTNRSYDSPSKSPTSPSCKTSPIRMPVTENDPLGALDMQEADEVLKAVDTHEDQAGSGSASLSSIVAAGILENAEAPGGPILFQGHTKTRGVSRSATFGHDCTHNECSNCMERGKSMHRSSTMPVDVSVSTAAGVTSGLGSISSGFKLPFSRYSPARLSLRKADLRIGTQIIENAITNFSPSSLTSKNELLRGGLSTLKSAGNLVAKKFDEFKEAISANSTPVKPSLGHGRVSGEAESLCYEEDTVDGSSGLERRVSSEFPPLTVHQHLDYFSSNILELFGDGSRKGSSSNLQPLDESGPAMWSNLQLLPEQLYPRDATIRDHHALVALELMMTTCSKCHNCSSVLHDEEILAGWSPEDSNLNTKCPFCGKATVPFLTVNVMDYRAQPMVEHGGSQESISRGKAEKSNLGSSISSVDGDVTGQMVKPHRCSGTDVKALQAEQAPVDLEPITVPYLNPLVLRKEFENILHNEGDSCLTQPRFVDEHPIIFWNMVWVFQRINIVSHLPGLCLQAASVNRNQVPHPSWENCDHNNVAIRCMWDNQRLHEEVGQPMYALWQQNEQPSSLVSALVTDRTSIPRSVMQMVISGVRCNDLKEPLKKLAIERQKLKGKGVNRSHSLYWDILFLAFTVMGRENIDHAVFDRQYMAAYDHLPERDLKLYQQCDKPPSIASLYCRHYFKELEL